MAASAPQLFVFAQKHANSFISTLQNNLLRSTVIRISMFRLVFLFVFGGNNIYKIRNSHISALRHIHTAPDPAQNARITHIRIVIATRNPAALIHSFSCTPPSIGCLIPLPTPFRRFPSNSNKNVFIHKTNIYSRIEQHLQILYVTSIAECFQSLYLCDGLNSMQWQRTCSFLPFWSAPFFLCESIPSNKTTAPHTHTHTQANTYRIDIYVGNTTRAQKPKLCALKEAFIQFDKLPTPPLLHHLIRSHMMCVAVYICCQKPENTDALRCQVNINLRIYLCVRFDLMRSDKITEFIK